MIESFLYDLTNRATGFVWPRLPEDPDFIPQELPDYAEAVRLDLRLDDETTDYFLLGVLNSLLGCPWVGEQVGELIDLAPLALYSLPPDGWVGGTLKASSKDPATFSYKPDIWPVELNWSLTYYNPQQSILKNGTQTAMVPTAVNPDGRLRVGWPEHLQARGVIDLDITWQDGAAVEFTHHPGAYPYRAVVAAMTPRRTTNQLLLHTGTAEGWHAARSDMERVALLALGLIRTYRKV